MALSISSAVSLFLCLLTSAAVATASPRLATVMPAWHVELRSAIGGTPLPYVYGGRYEIKNPLPMTSLWFTDNETLVATFVIQHRVRTSEPAHRSGTNDTSLPLLLRAIFLDPATGKVTANIAWPTEHRYSKIVAAYDRRLVVQRGNELTLYSPELSVLRELRLPQIKVYAAHWSASPSPTAKNILFTAPLDQRTACWLWVNALTLQIVREWDKQPGVAGLSISDDKIAEITSCEITPCGTASVRVRGLLTDWETIATSGHESLQFVNQDLLFLAGDAFPIDFRPMRLIRLNGQVLFSEPQVRASSGRRWGSPVVSAGGTKLVIPFYQTKGRIAALDVSGQEVLKKLLVYDVSADGQPHTLTVVGPDVNGYGGMALSPDGSKLAVLDGETLELFQLPTASEAANPARGPVP